MGAVELRPSDRAACDGFSILQWPRMPARVFGSTESLIDYNTLSCRTFSMSPHRPSLRRRALPPGGRQRNPPQRPNSTRSTRDQTIGGVPAKHCGLPAIVVPQRHLAPAACAAKLTVHALHPIALRPLLLRSWCRRCAAVKLEHLSVWFPWFSV